MARDAAAAAVSASPLAFVFFFPRGARARKHETASPRRQGKEGKKTREYKTLF
jgi:hypothetical protein